MAGTRKITAGIDVFFQGVLNGRDSHFRVDLVFCAPKKTGFEPPPPPLLHWVWTWIGVNNIDPLNTEGWFKEGHGIKGGKRTGMSAVYQIAVTLIGSHNLLVTDGIWALD